jgi:nucleotide-binding universal stress UspA family protein
MKKIIVPIDFSGDSLNALEHAMVIANKFKADVSMIHVKGKRSNYDDAFDFQDFNTVLSTSIKDYFELKVKKYKDALYGKLDYKIREGKIYIEIVNQAKYDDANLIVMGTHGVSGFEELWMGSNAYRVVSHSPCPVLTLRNDFNKKEFSKIVLPIDITKETRQKVPFVTELARAFNAEIYVVSISDTDKQSILRELEQYNQQVYEYITNKKVKCHTDNLLGANLTDITIDFAAKVDADLIAVMTEQTESAKNIFLGTYAQQMVNHSPFPVLSFRPY